MNETITIPLTTFQELVDDQLLLNCLRAAGVDNWDGYDFAIETYEEHQEQENN